MTAPNDPRLPERRAARTITGLYNVNPNVASLTNNVTKLATDAGGKYTQVYNGFLFNVSARPRNGLVFQGGVSTGTTAPTTARSARLRRNTLCSAPAELRPSPNPWCDTSTGFVTRYTGLGSYTIPKVDVLFSGTFRSDQGAPLARELDDRDTTRVAVDHPAARTPAVERAPPTSR